MNATAQVTVSVFNRPLQETAGLFVGLDQIIDLSPDLRVAATDLIKKGRSLLRGQLQYVVDYVLDVVPTWSVSPLFLAAGGRKTGRIRMFRVSVVRAVSHLIKPAP